MAKKKRIKVKKIVLARTHVLQIKVPTGHVPVVVTDPDRGVVEIAPAKPTWWQTLFSPAS